jgi:hypothetical protein
VFKPDPTEKEREMTKYMRLLGVASVVALMAGPVMASGMNYSYNGPWQTPAQNNARSAQYDYLLQTRPGFRAYRVRKECGPIRFIQELRQDCVASFDQYEPVIGY